MNKPIDYKELSQELDQLITKLQSEDVDIDEALVLYERGMTIAEQLQKYLKEAENKVTKIKGVSSKE